MPRVTRSDAIVLGQCNGRRFQFELAVTYDSSFCRMYGNSREATTKVIRALVYDVNAVFIPTTCVRMALNVVDAYCDDESDFGPPPDFNSCTHSSDSSKYKCNTSQSLLDHITAEWQNGISAGASRDAGFFFSGYEDRTELAGATYRAQTCNEQLSFAWVERGIAPVFAHEAGHMLGAQHDTYGVMTAAVYADQEIKLSNNTQMKIRKFVERDSRAWCMHRYLLQFPRLQRIYKWNNLHSVLTLEEATNISDATFAQAFDDDDTAKSKSSTVENDLMYLISRRSPLTEISKVTYSIARGMECDERSTCFIPKKYREFPIKEHEVPLEFEAGSFAFSLTFARLQSPTSRDLVVMHVRPHMNRKGRLRLRPFYRVGHGIGIDGSPPPKKNWWHKERTIWNFGAEDIQCASISMVNISPGSTTGSIAKDLLYIHIDRKKNRNVMQYWIGKDLSRTGYARGGWTKAIDVPGWYGRDTTGVAGAVVDMDGNGMPELILYHVDNTLTMKTGFIRIGKDLNSTGHVTNGWSDFIQSPNINQFIPRFRNAGTMALHPRMGLNRYPVVAAIQRQGFFTSWDLTVGASVLTPETLRTSRFRGGIEDLTLGCDECYAFKYTKQCKIDLGRCESTVDEVRLRDGSDSEDNKGIENSRFVIANETYIDEEVEEVEFEDDEFESDPNRPKKTTSDSLFCAGFHYLYTKRTGCDVVDRGTVIAKGVEMAFREAMEEVDAESAEDMESSSLFEVPAGPNGNGNPIVAQAVLYSKKAKYRDILELAFRKIRGRKGFEAIENPKATLKRTVRKVGDKWIVRFYFKAQHLRESNEI